MPHRVTLINENPQPAAKLPIPGYRVNFRSLPSLVTEANYESMAGSRPIAIKFGRVILRPGVSNVASELILPAPVSGGSGIGGDDESRLEIVSYTEHQHVVTAVGGFGGGKKSTAKFGGIGSRLELLALGGIWHVSGVYAVTLA